MALKNERTAYIYGVSNGISESVLSSVLSNGYQLDYSVRVDEVKEGVAVVKIIGSGLYNTGYLIFFVSIFLNVILLTQNIQLLIRAKNRTYLEVHNYCI